METKDPGSEAPEVYILETEDQLKGRNDETYRKNAELYKQWARKAE